MLTRHYIWMLRNDPKELEEKANPTPKPIKIRLEPSEWKKYQKLVKKITETQPIATLAFSDKRGFKSYHLDHKISIWHGFKNNIDPSIIANIDNLEFIPYKDNMRKGIKCKDILK